MHSISLCGILRIVSIYTALESIRRRLIVGFVYFYVFNRLSRAGSLLFHRFPGNQPLPAGRLLP